MLINLEILGEMKHIFLNCVINDGIASVDNLSHQKSI